MRQPSWWPHGSPTRWGRASWLRSLGTDTTAPIPLQVGCKQAGAATPLLSNILFAGPGSRLQQVWRDRGLGLPWAPELGGVKLLIGADNLFLLGASLEELRTHAEVLSGCPAEMLRIVLNAAGSTAVMMAHRERAAWKVWRRHRTCPTSRSVPAREGTARLHQTMGASAFYGAGLWTPSATSRRKLEAFEVRLLPRSARVRREPDETWTVFYRRCCAQTTRLYRAAGLPTFL